MDEQMQADVARGWPWRFNGDEVRSNRFYITGLAKPETHKAGGGMFVEGCDLDGAIAQAREAAAKGVLGLPLEDLAMISVWAISSGNDQQTIGAGPLWYTNLPEPSEVDPRSVEVLVSLAQTEERMHALRREAEYLGGVKAALEYLLGIRADVNQVPELKGYVQTTGRQTFGEVVAQAHEDGVDLGDDGASELLLAAADVVHLSPRSPAIDRLQEAVVAEMIDLGLMVAPKVDLATAVHNELRTDEEAQSDLDF